MSWQLERALEREEESLVNDLNDGLITQREFNQRMLDLQRDARAELEQEAWDAYERVMDGDS